MDRLLTGGRIRLHLIMYPPGLTGSGGKRVIFRRAERLCQESNLGPYSDAKCHNARYAYSKEITTYPQHE